MAKLIGTAGHVDHGKTTLIRALTGIDTDRLPEEKNRGLTIDVGFAYVDLPGVGRVSIVDVPGHERFLANMLVGALGIDVALLCVAADASVMPQTVEHFQIIEILPAERMVVALTRCDLADQDTISVAREEVEELLAPTRFKGSPIIAVSAKEGTGLDELKTELARALTTEQGSLEGPWFMPVDRAFAIKGHGVVVTGTMAQGTAREADKAVVMPEGLEVRVRSIECHDDPRTSSEKGMRTALNLNGVKLEEVHRGQIVGTAGVVFATSTLDATVKWLVKPKHGARVRVSIGADEAIAKAFLSDSDPGLLQLRFERPVAAAKGEPFIVRKYSPPTLLGGGRVTVPEAIERRKSAKTKPRIESTSVEDEVMQAVAQTRDGLMNDDLCRILGKSAQALGDTLETLKSSEMLYGFAGLWMTARQVEESSGRFLSALNALHEQEPSSLFQPREAVVSKAGLSWKGKPLDRIVAHLATTGSVRIQGTGVAHSGFRVKFGEKQRALLDRVIAELSRNGLSVPNPDEVASSINVPRPAVNEIIKIGMSAGEIVRIEDGIFVPVQAIEVATARLSQEFKGRQFTAAEFREAFGTSRKYAIPFLEYLDSKGVTKRIGDVRVLAKS